MPMHIGHQFQFKYWNSLATNYRTRIHKNMHRLH